MQKLKKIGRTESLSMLDKNEPQINRWFKLKAYRCVAVAVAWFIVRVLLKTVHLFTHAA